MSGAGHDSQILGCQIPTAMLFVPSRAGRSHSPAEFTPDEQLLPGVQTLADVLAELADEESMVRWGVAKCRTELSVCQVRQ